MGGSGLDFGDASDDNVVFKADISSSFIPNNDDSFDLGSDSQRWKTAYFSNLNLSGSLYVIGGPIDLHSDTYISASSGTFTHLDVGSYLDVDVTGNTTFDGQGTLSVSSSGALKVDSPTSISIGTNSDAPIDIDSTTLDIDSSGDITIDASNSKIAIAAGTTASLDGEEGIHIGLEERVPVIIEGNSVTVNGSANVDVDADGGKLTLDGSTGIDIGVEADVPIDVDSSTFDLDASGHITISGSGASNIDIDAGGNIRVDAGTGMFIGTAQNLPIDIDSTTFDLDASGNITLDSTTAINVGTATSGVPISIGHTTSETTINDNLTVTGNFTVNGTTTYVSSSNVTIGDRIIELNYLGATGNGGIYVGDADGTTTSGSLLWDSSNDYWIAGAKDLEQKILLQNGDSVISGSGANNQITTFTGTHEVDSSANLTFDGSTLRITGTEEITGNLSGSATASFKDVSIADDLDVGGNITIPKTGTNTGTPSGIGVLYFGNTTNRIFNDNSGGTLRIQGSGNIESNAPNHRVLNSNGDLIQAGDSGVRLYYQNSEKFTTTTGGIEVEGTITATGKVSGSTAQFGNVLISGSIIQAPGGSPLVINDTLNLDSNDITGVQNITATATGSFGRVIGSIGATNGVISGSSQVVLGTIPGFNTYTGSVDTEQLVQDNRLNHLSSATGSYLTSSGSVAFSDITSKPSYLVGNLVPGNNVTITSGSDTLTIEASAGGGGGGTISGSSQIDHDATTNFVAGEHFLQTDITTVGTVTAGNVQAILPSGVISGSLLPGSNVTINSSSDGFFISSSAAGGGANDATITLTAGSGLDGGGAFTVNQSGNEEITFTVSDGVVSGSSQLSGTFLSKLGDGVVSGSAQINKTLNQVTDVSNGGGNLSNFALTVGDGTNSTSKTTGGLIVSGGLGVLNTINAGGDVIAFATSDERLKDNIKPIENPLEVISQISGNTFDWNSEKQNIYNGKDYGVIAQEIQKVMPELVDTRDNGYLAVKYDKIVPLLIESIKELKKEIEELKSK